MKLPFLSLTAAVMLFTSRAAQEPILAQTPTETAILSIPFEQIGVLVEGDEILEDGSLFDVYTFTGQANQIIKITLTSEVFDTHLMVLDTNVEPIASNDDSYNSTNSELTIQIPQAGEYYLFVTSYGLEARGEYYIKAEVSTETDLKKSEADQLLAEASNLLRTSQWQDALEWLDQSLVLYQDVGDRQQEALTLVAIAVASQNLGQYEKSIQAYQQSLPIYQAIGDRTTEGEILFKIGEAYNELREYDKALQVYQQSLYLRQEIGDRTGEVDTLSGIGEAYLLLEKYEEALQYYEKSLNIFKALNDREREGATLLYIGTLYNNLRQYENAIYHYKKGLLIIQEIDDRISESITLSVIASMYSNLEQYAQSLSYYQQSLAISQVLGDRQLEGEIFSEIGLVYRHLGEYAQALDSYHQSINISSEIGDQVIEGDSKSGMGSVYAEMGQYEQALHYLEQDLKIRQEIGDQGGEAVAANNIGFVYGKLGQYDLSLEYHKKSLLLFEQLGDLGGESSALNNIGHISKITGEYDQAIQYYQKSLSISQEIGDQSGEGVALNNIGRLYDVQGYHSQALQYFEQSLPISQVIGNKILEATILNNMGKIFSQIEQYSDAERMLSKALEAWESLRDSDLGDASKVSLLETQVNVYEALQQNLIAQVKPNAALIISERGRTRAMVELLGQNTSSRLGQELSTEAPGIEDIKGIANNQNATLINYSVIDSGLGDPTLYIWVIQPDGTINFVEQPLEYADSTFQNPIAQLNGAFYRGVSQSDATVTQVADLHSTLRGVGIEWDEGVGPSDRLKEFHQLLIDPIAQYLPADPDEKVIFIPQGGLFLVPFAALQDENDTYLIEKHTILTAPSIQVLGLTHDLRPPVGSNHLSAFNTEDFLIVGNPTMPSVPTRPGDPEIILNPLSGAEDEAEAIASLFNTTPLIGNVATETTVTQKLSTAKVVHLATHGLLDYGQVQVSGIRDVPGAVALAPDAQADGLLTSAEILDLELNADLVVLSACDTGRGDIRGDGVIGLSRSLITSGVPSIIVSLWQVPDIPTANVMTEFYRQLQHHPDKAQALRQAMLTTMQDYPHPRNWSAFTLIGQP